MRYVKYWVVAGATVGLYMLFMTVIGPVACTDNASTRNLLQDQGYTNVQTTGYALGGCGKGDQYHTTFTATSPSGTGVSGIVCGGFRRGSKGSTVRFF